MLSIRCSLLPTLRHCAAAATPPAVQLSTGPVGERDLGNGVHDYLDRRINGRDFDVHEIAYRWQIEDVAEFRECCEGAWRGWQKVAHYFPNPQTEVPLKHVDDTHGLTLTGKLDLVSPGHVGRNKVLICDWKNGWADRDCSEQLKGYAWLAMNELGADAARCSRIRTRYRDAETYEWSRIELTDWWLSLCDHLTLNRERYAPGPQQCRFCPRAHECPGRRALMATAADFIARDGPTLADITGEMCPEELIACLERVRMVAPAVEAISKALKEEVAIRGGTVRAADGRELTLVKQDRRSILFTPAEPILRPLLGDETFAECCKIGKTAVEKAIKATCGRGFKGAAVAEAWEQLAQAEAFEVTSFEKLEVRNVSATAIAAE